MSYYIKVNHKQLETTASVIDAYISKHERNMNAADQQIHILGASWQGQDFQQFQVSWNKERESSSISKMMTKSLKSYEDFLIYTANQYKNAQANAVNRANGLIVW